MDSAQSAGTLEALRCINGKFYLNYIYSNRVCQIVLINDDFCLSGHSSSTNIKLSTQQTSAHGNDPTAMENCNEHHANAAACLASSNESLANFSQTIFTTVIIPVISGTSTDCEAYLIGSDLVHSLGINCQLHFRFSSHNAGQPS